MPRPGTTSDRGYGAAHQRLRAELTPKVATGTVTCWRCGTPITPTQPWDLGHDDHDPTRYRGPEHANTCNRAAGARKRHANRTATPPTGPRFDTSRPWGQPRGGTRTTG